MKRFHLNMALLALCCFAALAGCQKKEAAPGQSAAQDITLRFSWWGADPRHQATLKAMDLFAAQNPGVKMEGEYQGFDGYQQKLMTQIAGGTEPDIVQFDYGWITSLCAQGNPFVDFYKQQADLSGFSEALLKDFCTNRDGELMGMPAGQNAYTLVGNKKFMAKYNIPLDTIWTWNNILDFGARIHAANAGDYLLFVPSNIIDEQFFSRYILNKTGKHWATSDNKKINITEAEALDAFTLFQRLFSTGAMQPLGEASLFAGIHDQNPKWASVEIGLTFEAASNVVRYKPAMGGEENLFVANFPRVDGGVNEQTYVKPSVLFGVSKKSKSVEMAVKFVNFVMNDPEAIKILADQRGLPCNSRGVELLMQNNLVDPFMSDALMINSQQPMSIPPAIMYDLEVVEAMKNLCELVAAGNLSPADAAKLFMTDIQTLMDSLQATYS